MASKENFRAYVRDRVLSLYGDESVARIRTINEVDITEEEFKQHLFKPYPLPLNHYLEVLVDEKDVRFSGEYFVATIGDGEFYAGADRRLWTPMHIGEKPMPILNEIEACWKELHDKIGTALGYILEEPDQNKFYVHAEIEQDPVATCNWRVDSRQLVRLAGDARSDEELIYAVDNGMHSSWSLIKGKWWAFNEKPFEIRGLTPYIVEVRGLRNTIGIWWQAGIVPKYNIQAVKIAVN